MNHALAGGMAGPMEQLQARRRLDITLRENIEEQIAQAEAHLQTLKDTKKRLEESKLLDSRIDDIQRAMQW